MLARLVDGSQFQEFKTQFGSTLITGFAHIYGYVLDHFLARIGWEYNLLCWQKLSEERWLYSQAIATETLLYNWLPQYRLDHLRCLKNGDTGDRDDHNLETRMTQVGVKSFIIHSKYLAVSDWLTSLGLFFITSWR